MIRITKEQKDYLIEKGYLKLEKGRYPDLVVASKNKNSKGKTYYTLDSYKRLLMARSKPKK